MKKLKVSPQRIQLLTPSPAALFLMFCSLSIRRLHKQNLGGCLCFNLNLIKRRRQFWSFTKGNVKNKIFLTIVDDHFTVLTLVWFFPLSPFVLPSEWHPQSSAAPWSSGARAASTGWGSRSWRTSLSAIWNKSYLFPQFVLCVFTTLKMCFYHENLIIF